MKYQSLLSRFLVQVHCHYHRGDCFIFSLHGEIARLYLNCDVQAYYVAPTITKVTLSYTFHVMGWNGTEAG